MEDSENVCTFPFRDVGHKEKSLSSRKFLYVKDPFSVNEKILFLSTINNC